LSRSIKDMGTEGGKDMRTDRSKDMLEEVKEEDTLRQIINKDINIMDMEAEKVTVSLARLKGMEADSAQDMIMLDSLHSMLRLHLRNTCLETFAHPLLMGSTDSLQIHRDFMRVRIPSHSKGLRFLLWKIADDPLEEGIRVRGRDLR
jgi:hypothetical protein